MKRTPLPWKVHPLNPMAVHQPQLECWIPRVEADAKFIETACNAHDALVAALRWIVANDGQCLGDHPDRLREAQLALAAAGETP